jgi:hypothetical protein
MDTESAEGFVAPSVFFHGLGDGSLGHWWITEALMGAERAEGVVVPSVIQ